MPLAVDTFVTAPAQENCYLVRADDGAPEAVVIDPGGNAAALLLELSRMGATCAAILITHGHPDHLGGVADLAEGTGAKVLMPRAEREQLETPTPFPGYDVRAHPVDVALEGDETLDLAGIVFETMRIPGHTRGHVAFAADGCLFSGDLLFAGSVGRVDLPGGDWPTLVESIRMLTERFPSETIVYSGHGPVTTLGAELERNPFLAELRAS